MIQEGVDEAIAAVCFICLMQSKNLKGRNFYVDVDVNVNVERVSGV